MCGGRWSALLTAWASYHARDTRVWVAYARSNAFDPDTAVRQPGLSAGVERRVGPTIVALSFGPRRDRTASQRVIELTPHLFPEVVFPVGGAVVQETTFVADTVTRLGRRVIPDVRLALSWTRQALEIEAGAHVGLVGAHRWYSYPRPSWRACKHWHIDSERHGVSGGAGHRRSPNDCD
jgi:hypothetical protein